MTKAAKAAAKLAGTDPNQGPKPKPQPKPKAGNPDQSGPAGKGKGAGGGPKAEEKTRGRPSVNLSKIRARELALVARRNAPTAMINVSSMPVGNTLERMARRPVANRMPVAKKKVGIHQLDSADLGL